MNICIWGTEDKAKEFAEHMINASLVGVVDSDPKKWGKKFMGQKIVSAKEVDLSSVDLLAICSNAYEEIVGVIGEDCNVAIMAPQYYESTAEFDKLSPFEFLETEYVLKFKKSIDDCLVLKYGELVLEYLDNTVLDKQTYPISVYTTPPRAEELLIERLFRKFLDKYDCTIIQNNTFGFKNYICSADSFINIARYGIPTDAYPWLCLIDEMLSKGEMKSSCAFDIGANTGVVSSFLAKRFEVVHAFEPSKFSSQRARENIELNAYSNILWNEVAVGDSNEMHTYYDYGGDGGNNSLIEQDRDCISQYSVQTILLDNYCKECNVDYIDFLKMDVEGYESRVIAGAQNIIEEKKVHYICLEISPGLNKDSEAEIEMISYLIDKGFDFYNVYMDNLTIDEIKDITIHQDIIGLCKGSFDKR